MGRAGNPTDSETSEKLKAKRKLKAQASRTGNVAQRVKLPPESPTPSVGVQFES